jgi:hypothetical protein
MRTRHDAYDSTLDNEVGMPGFRRLAIALLLVASAACSNSVDLADPNVLAQELRGTWSRIIAPGSSTVLQLTVQDSTIAGTGTFAGEAGPSGTLVVTGRIATGDFGPFVTIDFAQSNGPVGHFTGGLTAPDTLYGSVWYTATEFGTADPVPGTFVRTAH